MKPSNHQTVKPSNRHMSDNAMAREITSLHSISPTEISSEFTLVFVRHIFTPLGRSIATSECKGENLDSLRNRLLFTPAAPPSFWRTLMRNLGAPAAASACGQVNPSRPFIRTNVRRVGWTLAFSS